MMNDNSKNIPNQIAVNGTVQKLDIRDKASSIKIQTGENTLVTMFAFSPVVKNIVDNQIKEGDTLHLEGTIQSNNAASGFPTVNYAINHINYVDKDSRFIASFKITGNPHGNIIADGKATALVRTDNGKGICNNIRLYFSSDERSDLVEKFGSLRDYQKVTFYGYVDSENRLQVTSWRHVPKVEQTE